MSTLTTRSARWVGPRKSSRQVSWYRHPRWPRESQNNSNNNNNRKKKRKGKERKDFQSGALVNSSFFRCSLLTHVLILPHPWADPNSLLLVPSIFQTHVGVVRRQGFPGQILGTRATVLQFLSRVQSLFSWGVVLARPLTPFVTLNKSALSPSLSPIYKKGVDVRRDAGLSGQLLALPPSDPVMGKGAGIAREPAEFGFGDSGCGLLSRRDPLGLWSLSDGLGVSYLDKWRLRIISVPVLRTRWLLVNVA